MPQNDLILRPYIPRADFEVISKWITQPSEHAMWCAGRTKFPIEREDFQRMLDDIAVRCGDSPYIAAAPDGTPIGFYCYSLNGDTNEGMLKFVMIDPECRGKGYGKQMLRLALDKVFSEGADRVRLCVLSVNDGAKRCYESLGFEYCGTDEGAFRYENEMWDRCHMVIENGGKLCLQKE